MQYRDRYLLTDPWYNKPAFGSWLPSFAPYIHPTYLAALGERLTILVSHGHDDHLDDRLLGIFDKKTKIVTADFTAPSVVNRLKYLGFENISTVCENETKIDEVTLDFTGPVGLFSAKTTITEPGHYKAIVYIFDKDTGNVGVDRTMFEINSDE